MRNPWTMMVVLALMMLSQVAVASAQESGIKITEMAVTTKIVKMNPIDDVKRISSTSVKALYCFTRITAPGDEETTIKHQWFRNDQLVSDNELPVKSRQWRTYSKRLIDKSSAGEWRVEARDHDDKLLRTVKFRIN